jgi:two-component system, cell cycle response regulator
MRVCVADDNPEVAAVLVEGLLLHHYDAFHVSTGQQALDACRKQQVDCVLLDVCMPEMDGYEVCRRLKEDPKTSPITVIFVTVKGSKEDIRHGLSLGAADYITKPFNLPMVMIRVDAAICSKGAKRPYEPTGGALFDTTYTDELTGLRNRSYLLSRLDEEVEKAHRYNYPVSCVVFDIDELQALDEELGPVSMDDLLVELAMALRNHTRNSDIVARYDGTVFAALLPHSPVERALSYASKILEEVDATTFSDPSFPTMARLSIGIATCQNGSANGAEAVLGEAMHSLLQAKSRGEERIVARNLAGE